MTVPEVVAPATAAEVATVLDAASEQRRRVLIRGGGTHQGYGNRVDADVVVSTERLDAIVDWSPDDLTAVVEAGVRVADLESRLAERGQTAVLPEVPGEATVGGVIAAGISGWRRLRYGPTRDRVLEVVLATGDGRVVTAGGRVVKNVTGYDLPRLATGSFGSLGVIVQVALKLWPVGSRTATLTVDDAESAAGAAFRPLAVIEADDTTKVYLAGTDAEVDAQAEAVGGERADGLGWPAPLEGHTVVVVRVPPALTRGAVERVPRGWRYQAGLGVGEVVMAGSDGDIPALRAWAETVGGAAVLARAPEATYLDLDPWGDPGPTLDLQRRVKAAFDPLGVCNPGRLPGNL